MQGTSTEIDLQFIALVKAHDYESAVNVMGHVTDINIQDPDTSYSALHFAALRSANNFMAELEKRRDLNYCVVDKKSRPPSTLAWMEGQNEELAFELMKKEHKYAKRHGLSPWKPWTLVPKS